MAGLHVFQGCQENFPSKDQVGDHKAYSGDLRHGVGEKLSDDEERASGDQLRKIVGMLVVTACICRFSFLADLDDGARFDLVSNLLHLREQLCSFRRVDPELSRRESQNTVIDFRELLDLFLDLCGAVRAVDVFHHVDHTGGFRCRTVVVFGVLMMMIVFGAAAIVIIVMMMFTAAVLFMLVIIIVLVMVMVPTAAVLFMPVIMLIVMVMVSAAAVLFMPVIMLIVMMMVSAAANLFVLVVC